MHDGKKELPEIHRTILALLVFEDVPPLPLTGFLAETIDTHEKYFHAFNRIGYSTELIRKWDYLDEIAPGYCIKRENLIMDLWFNKKFCDRCGKSLADGFSISRFDTSALCFDCLEEERQHPDFQKAVDAELAALRSGNRNFEGIGWPGKNGRVK